MYVYLSSPYSHPDPMIRARRYEEVLDCATHFMKNKVWVFSPIVHCHPMALKGLPGDIEYWRAYNHVMVAASREVWVLALDGWRESLGVKEEANYALRRGISVRYVDPTNYAVSS